jgi:hypothetical protein
MRNLAEAPVLLDLLVQRYKAEILAGKQPVLDHSFLLIPDLTGPDAAQLVVSLEAFLYRNGMQKACGVFSRFICRGSGWGVYAGPPKPKTPLARSRPRLAGCVRPGARRR